MIEMRVSGECLCGAVQYSGEADPLFQVKCYCSDCRKTSGAGHAAMIGFPIGAVSITGDVNEFRSTADSGTAVTRGFCPSCGSGVYSRNAAMPHIIFLRASTLDDPDLFSPQLVVYASRAPAWDPVSEGVPTFSESPPRS
jgi:hypothetical protein